MNPRIDADELAAMGLVDATPEDQLPSTESVRVIGPPAPEEDPIMVGVLLESGQGMSRINRVQRFYGRYRSLRDGLLESNKYRTADHNRVAAHREDISLAVSVVLQAASDAFQPSRSGSDRGLDGIHSCFLFPELQHYDDRLVVAGRGLNQYLQLDPRFRHLAIEITMAWVLNSAGHKIFGNKAIVNTDIKNEALRGRGKGFELI